MTCGLRSLSLFQRLMMASFLSDEVCVQCWREMVTDSSSLSDRTDWTTFPLISFMSRFSTYFDIQIGTKFSKYSVQKDGIKILASRSNPEESSPDNGSAVIVFEGGSLIAFGSQVPNFHTMLILLSSDVSELRCGWDRCGGACGNGCGNGNRLVMWILPKSCLPRHGRTGPPTEPVPKYAAWSFYVCASAWCSTKNFSKK